nr:unnamed protein product [Callosobruchus analis]
MFYNYKNYFSIVLMAVVDANYRFSMIGKDGDAGVFSNSPIYQNIENGTLPYNYRLSRARMTVECTFGICSAKFRILLKSIGTKVENAVHISKAICILHNVIIDMEKESFLDDLQDYTGGNLRNFASKNASKFLTRHIWVSAQIFQTKFTMKLFRTCSKC